MDDVLKDRNGLWIQPVEETGWGTRRLYSVGEGITDAIISVDPDAKVAADVRAKMVDVDSWLFAEEFLVAFYDAGYDVQIAQR